MSIKAMSMVWERSRQSGSALLMLLAIADYAKDDGTDAWPSLSTLARKTRMGRRNAIEIVKKLEEDGELRVRRGAGPRGCNFYDIIFPSEVQFTTKKPEKKVVNPSSPPSESQFTSLVNPSSPALVNPDSPEPSCNRHLSVKEPSEGAAEKPPPSHDPTFLPENETQLPVLFPVGAEDADYEQTINRAGWQIRSVDIRRAVALFLEYTRLQIPFDKPARKDWLKHINIHVKTYGLDRLRELYPAVVSDMCENKLPISRPGSMTNPLAALVGEMNRNGGQRATDKRRPNQQRDPGEKFFDPTSGEFVRRCPDTGNLVPVS